MRWQKTTHSYLNSKRLCHSLLLAYQITFVCIVTVTANNCFAFRQFKQENIVCVFVCVSRLSWMKFKNIYALWHIFLVLDIFSSFLFHLSSPPHFRVLLFLRCGMKNFFFSFFFKNQQLSTICNVYMYILHCNSFESTKRARGLISLSIVVLSVVYLKIAWVSVSCLFFFFI